MQNYSATLTVTVYDIDHPSVTYPNQTITVTGTGIPAPPAFTITPSSVAFGNQIVNLKSAYQSVEFTNTTKDILRVQSITSSDPAFTTNLAVSGCNQALLPIGGPHCYLFVTFTPTAVQNYSATLTVTVYDIDHPGVSYPPQTIAVTGTGAAPAISLSTTALTFTTTTGTTSAAQSATLTNTGNLPLQIGSISLGGGNPNDYKETDNCGLSLAVGAACTLSVTFTPPSMGSYPASITLIDNALSSPQTIALSGTGTNIPNFVIASALPAAAVNPGGSALFALTVTAQNGASIPAITLTASGLPPGATASFSHSTVTPGSTSATSTLTIQTAPASAAVAGYAWPLLLIFTVLLLRSKARSSIRTLSLLLAVSIGTVTALSGCAGSVHVVQPAKTYDVTIVGTVGPVQQSTTVKLTVE